MKIALLSLVLFCIVTQITAKSCKCTYGTDCWPSQSDWENFNSTIGGRLWQTIPVLYNCHAPNIDPVTCAEIMENYFSTEWRSEQPATVQYPNFEVSSNFSGCVDLTPTSKCSLGALPYYVVEAETENDVVAAVSFASENNLRLIVKNSGHCFLGRSTGAGALSIWVRKLANISFSDDFTPEGGPGADNSGEGPAVIVSAGAQWVEVYDAVEAKGYVVVGGAQRTVSAGGGYTLGGGHSPLSPTFGLAVDNVLQYRVVTADGQLRVANQYQNSDLFWALRGGGGSTFGVVVEIVYKVYPALENIYGAAYIVNSTTDEGFSKLFDIYIQLQPGWADMGFGSYSYVGNRTMTFIILLPNTDSNTAQNALNQFLNAANSINGVQVTTLVEYLFPSFASFYKILEPSAGTTGAGVLLGSRLLPRTLFENNSTVLGDALLNTLNQNTAQGGSGTLILHLVAGGAVSRNNDTSITSVTPAWRTAIWHAVISYGSLSNETWMYKDQINQALNQQIQPLVDLTPGGGAYQNEANSADPNWQQAFFGENYQRLLDIKNQYDPNDLFLCTECVGSEYWTPDLTCPIDYSAAKTVNIQ